MYGVETPEWIDGLATLPSLQDMKDTHVASEEE
jgi:hypothetical protein